MESFSSLFSRSRRLPLAVRQQILRVGLNNVGILGENFRVTRERAFPFIRYAADIHAVEGNIVPETERKRKEEKGKGIKDDGVSLCFLFAAAPSRFISPLCHVIYCTNQKCLQLRICNFQGLIRNLVNWNKILVHILSDTWPITPMKLFPAQLKFHTICLHRS